MKDDRITKGRSNKGITWEHKDAWPVNNDPWTKETPCVGLTIFFLSEDHQEEENTGDITDHDTYTLTQEQCWEYEIHFTEEEIQKILHPETPLDVFLATTAKKQRAEVKLSSLSAEHRAEFERAKAREADQWLDTETVRRILRSKIPLENIMRCRWILTWKELDPNDLQPGDARKKAKARLVILGYEDPNIEDIPRDSPTLQRESRSILLQICASKRWSIEAFDVKTAFLRGSRRDNRLLGVEPPEEMRRKMGLKAEEVCELRKSAYGLVNAPYLWYQELKEALLSLQFVMSPMDPCLFVLPGPQGQIHGILGIHVDDGIGCGNHVYQQTIQQLQNRFPFGAHRRKNFVFTGIQVDQQENGNIELSQREYIEKIEPITINRDRRKKGTLSVTSEEKQAMRGLIGSLQYAATNTRPDVSSRLSHLQSRINCAQVQDLHECNRLLEDSKKHSQVKVVIKSIPIEDIRFLVYSDASFATREKQQSQKGGLVMAIHKDGMNQKVADASPIYWHSKKIDRVVSSTLAAETYALSSAVDILEWFRVLWQWAISPSEAWKTPETSLEKAPRAMAVVDCKSLYDVIIKNTTPQCREHRTLLEALVIKDRTKQGVDLHWVHSAAQLADSLTKAMDTTNLRVFLSHGRVCLHDVEAVLQERADRKQQKLWLREQISPEQFVSPKLSPENNIET